MSQRIVDERKKDGAERPVESEELQVSSVWDDQYSFLEARFREGLVAEMADSGIVTDSEQLHAIQDFITGAFGALREGRVLYDQAVNSGNRFFVGLIETNMEELLTSIHEVFPKDRSTWSPDMELLVQYVEELSRLRERVP